jgi:pimeloyl-ACP methyl ester carboxylesterase
MIYFCRGVPGGREDASLLGIEGVAAPDLFAAAPLAPFDAATAGAPDGSVHLIRFSIGAMVALRLAASRPDKVGKPVFRIAKRLPSLLRFVTGLQGLVVKIAPDFMLDRLFAKAEPHERRLVSEPEVRKALRAGLRNSMVNHPTAYVQAISAYVGDWSGALQMVTSPVEIWHGEADSWAPVAMSEALVQNLTKGAQLRRIAGAGHYGALKAARITPIT